MIVLIYATALTASAGQALDECSSPELPVLPDLVLPRLQAIVNGQEEPDFPQTVALGAFGFAACTGSLITPRIVLTAGHCGDGIPLDLVVSLGSAYFGPSVAEATDELGFVRMEIHPSYVPLATDGLSQTLPEYDVALLELDGDAPVAPVWFNTRALGSAAVGDEVISVGFGITSAAGEGSGVKRSAPLTIDGVDDFFVLSDSNTNQNDANICSGDSGGPQYHWNEARGEWVQWAVHSWGDQDCLHESGSTRTDVAADFILDFVEQVHGTRDMCAAMGRYGDSVCDISCDYPDPDCSQKQLAQANPTPGYEPAQGKGCSSGGGGPSLAWLAVALIGLRRRR